MIQEERSNDGNPAPSRSGFSEVIATTVPLIGLCYMIGWFEAKAYFRAFGAEWLASQLTATELLQFSWAPLISFAIVFVVLLDSRVQHVFGQPRHIKLVVLAVIVLPLFALLGMLLTSFLGWQVLETLFIFAYLLCTAVFVALAVRALLRSLRQQTVETPLQIAVLGGCIALFGFLVLPDQHGRALGLVDLNIRTSTLSVVEATDSNLPPLRLLRLHGDTVFAVELLEGEKPKIYVLPLHGVRTISQYTTSNNNLSQQSAP